MHSLDPTFELFHILKIFNEINNNLKNIATLNIITNTSNYSDHINKLIQGFNNSELKIYIKLYDDTKVKIKLL